MEAAVQAACVEGEAGKDGAWKNGDQDGLGPGSRGGRMQMLPGGGFRGRINHTRYWLDISKGSRQEVMKEKAGEPGEGSVIVLSTKERRAPGGQRRCHLTQGSVSLSSVLPC